MGMIETGRRARADGRRKAWEAARGSPETNQAWERGKLSATEGFRPGWQVILLLKFRRRQEFPYRPTKYKGYP